MTATSDLTGTMPPWRFSARPSRCSQALAASTSERSRPGTLYAPLSSGSRRRSNHGEELFASRFAVIRDDILNVSTRDILRAAGLRGSARPDLLLAARHAPRSLKSGFWLEWKRSGLDPDASLLQAYTRVLAEAKPRAFVLENVYALTYNNRASRPAYERLLREIDAAGYTWRARSQCSRLRCPASKAKVVHRRGRKRSRQPELPDPTHGGIWERRTSGSHGRPHVTAGEALDGLVADPEPEETLSGQYAPLLGRDSAW